MRGRDAAISVTPDHENLAEALERGVALHGATLHGRETLISG